MKLFDFFLFYTHEVEHFIALHRIVFTLFLCYIGINIRNILINIVIRIAPSPSVCYYQRLKKPQKSLASFNIRNYMNEYSSEKRRRAIL